MKMITDKFISNDRLREKGACREGRKWFKETFPKGCMLSTFIKKCDKLNWIGWVIEEIFDITYCEPTLQWLKNECEDNLFRKHVDYFKKYGWSQELEYRLRSTSNFDYKSKRIIHPNFKQLHYFYNVLNEIVQCFGDGGLEECGFWAASFVDNDMNIFSDASINRLKAIWIKELTK